VVQLHFEQTRKQESDNVKQELQDIATSLVRDKINSKRVQFAENEFNDENQDPNQDPVHIEDLFKHPPQKQNTNPDLKNQLENEQNANLISNLENIGQESPDLDEASKLNCKIAEYNPMFYDKQQKRRASAHFSKSVSRTTERKKKEKVEVEAE